MYMIQSSWNSSWDRYKGLNQYCTNYTNKNNKSYQEYRKFVTTENSKINKQRITGTAIGQWSTRHNLSGLSCYQVNPGSNPTIGGNEMLKIHTVDGLIPWNTLFQCIYGTFLYYNLKNQVVQYSSTTCKTAKRWYR